VLYCLRLPCGEILTVLLELYEWSCHTGRRQIARWRCSGRCIPDIETFSPRVLAETLIWWDLTISYWLSITILMLYLKPCYFQVTVIAVLLKRNNQYNDIPLLALIVKHNVVVIFLRCCLTFSHGQKFWECLFMGKLNLPETSNMMTYTYTSLLTSQSVRFYTPDMF